MRDSTSDLAGFYPCLVTFGNDADGRCFHRFLRYTSLERDNVSGESAIMALKAVEQVADQVPADDFQALEEKVYRTIDMYKAARQAQAAAERDAGRLRQQLEDREEQLDTLRSETVRLKKEREEIRSRVEKMLEQIESIAEEQAAS
jgi:translation initiation factor 2B subunit (eIF-2B alpha/beta/delta family)